MRQLGAGLVGMIMVMPAGADAQLTRERFAAAIADSGRAREERFQQSGHVPAAMAATADRAIRRFALTIWVPNAIPTIELERAGKHTIARLYRGGKQLGEWAIDPVIWDRLSALDDAVFAVPDYAATQERMSRPRPWASCHGDEVAFQSIEHGRIRDAGGNQCAGSLEAIDEPKRFAAGLFAQVMLEARPSCADRLAADPLKALEACFRRADEG